MSDSLTPSAFVRALVSALRLDGVTVLQPKSAADRRGFRAVVRAIAQQAESLRRGAEQDGAARQRYREIVRLRNRLRPSNSGAFDAIEALLRDLQTSLLLHPNYEYERMPIDFDKAYARSLLSDLDDESQALVRRAAEDFRLARTPA